MAHLMKRSNGYYYVKFRDDDGTWRTRSLGAKTERAANAKFKDWQAGRLKPPSPSPQAEPTPADDTLTFADLEKLVDAWAQVHRSRKQREVYGWALRSFETTTGIGAISLVTPEAVLDYRTARLASGVSNRTVNLAVQNCRIAVKIAIEQGRYAGPNPFANLKPLKEAAGQVRFLTKSQRSNVLEKAEQHSRNIFLFVALGLYAGLRKNEIVNARWAWLDFKVGTINIPAEDGPFRTKSRRPRFVPLHKDLRTILKRLRPRELEPDAYIIETWCRRGTNFYRWDCRRPFSAVVNAAGVPWCTPHILRHTFASHAVQAGVSLYKVAKWMGHSMAKVTELYAHLSPGDRDIDKI